MTQDNANADMKEVWRRLAHDAIVVLIRKTPDGEQRQLAVVCSAMQGCKL